MLSFQPGSRETAVGVGLVLARLRTGPVAVPHIVDTSYPFPRLGNTLLIPMQFPGRAGHRPDVRREGGPTMKTYVRGVSLLAALVLTLTACGGGGGSSKSAAARLPGASDSAGAAAPSGGSTDSTAAAPTDTAATTPAAGASAAASTGSAKPSASPSAGAKTSA